MKSKNIAGNIKNEKNHKQRKEIEMLNKYLDVNPEVAQAVAEGRPVVALESTIISHGMPYPQNVETALKVEQMFPLRSPFWAGG